MISTRDLSALPDPQGLAQRVRALATLDAVLCTEWEFRYFTFQAEWEPGDAMAMMRNGEGDDFQIVFAAGGAIVKGFDHQAPMAKGRPWPGLFEGVPALFEPILADEAFAREASTFCFWRLADADGWTVGQGRAPGASSEEAPAGGTATSALGGTGLSADPDGSARLLRFLDGDPATYVEWASEYYGRPLDLEAVRHVFGEGPLDAALARRLDPAMSDEGVAEVLEEVRAIGHPTA